MIAWHGKCQCGQISDLFLVTWDYNVKKTKSTEMCSCGNSADNLVDIDVNVWRGWRKGRSLARNGMQSLCDACLEKYYPQSAKSKRWSIFWNICKQCIKKGHPRIKQDRVVQSHKPNNDKNSNQKRKNISLKENSILKETINVTTYKGIPLSETERKSVNAYLNAFLIGFTNRTEEILKVPFFHFWDKARIIPEWMYLPLVRTIVNVLRKSKVMASIYSFFLDKYFHFRYVYGDFLLRRGLNKGFGNFMKDFHSIYGFRKSRKKRLLLVASIFTVSLFLFGVLPEIAIIANSIGFAWCLIEALQWIFGE